MPLFSKSSNIVQNIFYLYEVTGFTELCHSIPVATKCNIVQNIFSLYEVTGFTELCHSIPVATKCLHDMQHVSNITEKYDTKYIFPR